MTTLAQQHAARLTRGRRVVLPGGVLGDVGGPSNGSRDPRIRVNFLDGRAAGLFYADELKTRAEWLYHARSMIVRVAQDIGDVDLERAADDLSREIIAAADRANALDAEVSSC